jgi:hypothetical protein
MPENQALLLYLQSAKFAAPESVNCDFGIIGWVGNGFNPKNP